jgi:hypothetical protein
MRIGLTIIVAIFAIVLLTGDTSPAVAQSCSGSSCAATPAAGCQGSSVGCAGRSGPVRGLFQRRPLRRMFGGRLLRAGCS